MKCDAEMRTPGCLCWQDVGNKLSKYSLLQEWQILSDSREQAGCPELVADMQWVTVSCPEHKKSEPNQSGQSALKRARAVSGGVRTEHPPSGTSSDSQLCDPVQVLSPDREFRAGRLRLGFCPTPWTCDWGKFFERFPICVTGKAGSTLQFHVL